VYCIEAVNKREVGYQCYANNVIANIAYGLLFLLVYALVVLVLCVDLVIYSKLSLV